MIYSKTKYPDRSRSALVFSASLAIALGLLITQSFALAAGALSAVVVILFFSEQPLKASLLLVLFFPFSEAMHLRERLIDVPGGKLIFLLGLFVVAVLLLNQRKSLPLSRWEKSFLVTILVLFSIAIFRSLAHLDAINLHSTDQLNSLRYLLSNYLKPLVYLIPFYAVAKFLRDESDIHTLTNAVSLALISLSLVVLYLFIVLASASFAMDTVLTVYMEYLGMHRNNIASFYILGLPLVFFGVGLNHKLLRLVGLSVCLLAVGILFSRTAYLTTLLMFLGFFLLLKRQRMLSLAIMAAVLLALMFNTAISYRASKGFEQGSVNEVSAGRIDEIWLPLVKELAGDPKKLLFGSGRQAIAYSDSAEKNLIQFVLHPHNMYLEQVLDIGLIGAAIIWGFLAVLLRRLISLARRKPKDIFGSFAAALTIALLCFLLAGLSGRTLFPALPTCYVWLLLGCAAAVVRVADQGNHHVG